MFGMYSNVWYAVYANSNDAYIPEVWAAESLMVLQNNLVAANLIHRDFSNEIASFGDVVNTRKPADFTMKRKKDTQDVTIQDAVSSNVGVKLDQQGHVSFLIRDGEAAKGMKNLVDAYLEPAIISIAQGVDEVVTGMVYQYLANIAGQLGSGGSIGSILEARRVMYENKAPTSDRHMLLTPKTESDLLALPTFTEADKIGDDGTALREGSLGRKYGFNMWLDQNTPSVATGGTVVTGAVNNVAGYAKGTTTMTVDGFSAALTNGSWFTVGGDLTPQRIVSTVGGATPTSITLTPGLRSGVANNDVITVYTPGAVNNAPGYAVGETGSLVVDGFTTAPQAGQLVSFGSAPAVYSALSAPTTTSIDANRALQAALVDNDVVGVGPAGDYNFFFHRNALSLVSRPLALPDPATGALSAIANFNDLAIRVVMTYDGKAQGMLVTLDLLFGVEPLDTALGGVMFA